LNAVLPAIRALGGGLAVICPQLPEYLADLKAKQTLDFPLLHDFGNAYAATLGIAMTVPDDLAAIYGKFNIDLPKVNGDGAWRLPVPSRWIVDGAGILRDVFDDPDYTIRPEPEETVAKLRAIV
jgi:peroxiredoxin